MADRDALDMTLDLYMQLRRSLNVDAERSADLDDVLWHAEIFERLERVFQSAVIFVADIGGSQCIVVR